MSKVEISNLVSMVKPYIFGGTPIREAFIQAQNIFNTINNDTDKKILFIISDGIAKDNGLNITTQLKRKKVMIFSCLISEDNSIIENNGNSLFLNCIQTFLFELCSIFRLLR